MSEDVDSEKVMYAADSLSEFVERVQYQQLLEARQEALERLRDARIMDESQKQSEQQAGAINARSGVESYILTAKEVMKQSDAGSSLWEDEQIATFHIGDAVHLQEEVKDVTSVKTSLPTRNGAVYVTGLKTYLAIPDHPVEVKYEKELPRRGHATETKTTRMRLTTPIEVSVAAFSATESLLRKMDIGISIGEDDDAGWEPDDYRDGEE